MSDDLEQMLNAAHRLSGQARYAALDTVFRHADAAGRTEFGFRARMGAHSEFHHQGEYARAFLAFQWCLSTFDRHPEVAQSHDAHQLLWRFKWIVWQLSQFSAVPLDRTQALLDDMARRYREGGHSPHAVHQHRALIATHLGDLDGAAHWFAKMETARRDPLSDCAACVPTSQVEFLVARGDFEAAVRTGAPYASGGCSEQPHQMLSHLLLPYLRTGRTDQAVDAHRKSYQRIRDNRHYLELIALHVEFCALTGNAEHGLPIVERHLPWLDRPASPYAAMEFASAAALLLGALPPETPVRRRTDSGDRRWASTAAESGAELAELARKLAADFDARNGNAHQSGRVSARIAATPLLPSLALTVFAGRPIADHPGRTAVDKLIAKVAGLTATGDHAAAALTRLDVAYALRNAGQWGDATEAAEEAVRSLDRAGLTAESLTARHLLMELYERGWPTRQLAGGLMDELLAAESLPPGLPSRPALLEQAAQMMGTRRERSVALLTEAAEAHRTAGDTEAEMRVLTRLLHRAAPDAAVARLDSLTTESAPVNTIVTLCNVDNAAGRHEAALARARRLRADVPAVRITAAAALLGLGRPGEAEDVARSVLGDDDERWSAIRLVAQAMIADGRDPTAFLAEYELDLEDLDDEDD